MIFLPVAEKAEANKQVLYRYLYILGKIRENLTGRHPKSVSERIAWRRQK